MHKLLEASRTQFLFVSRSAAVFCCRCCCCWWLVPIAHLHLGAEGEISGMFPVAVARAKTCPVPRRFSSERHRSPSSPDMSIFYRRQLRPHFLVLFLAPTCGRTCTKINKESNRARVVYLPKPFPRYQETQKRIENIYEVRALCFERCQRLGLLVGQEA